MDVYRVSRVLTCVAFIVSEVTFDTRCLGICRESGVYDGVYDPKSGICVVSGKETTVSTCW